MIPRILLAPDYSISRVIKGGWHLAGDHGRIDPEQAQRDMAAFVETGITTFDCADIYTGVEELIGVFRQTYPELAKRVQVHTKFVPDLSDLASIGPEHVQAIIDRSLKRLRLERLDLVQFHWWDYETPRYVEIALELERLQRAGKIAHIGVTNFDVPHLRELVEAGITVRAHQLQFSCVDDRPQGDMVGFCASNDIALLCYGTALGGFMSERWLGAAEPAGGLENRSLTKYKLIIDDFGGWALFQELLETLRHAAAKHGVDIATVAARAMLDRPQVAAVIVGATNTAHLPAHGQVGSLWLDDDDRRAIAAVTARRAGPAGDVYVLERDRAGRHGQIIKYELNKFEASGPTGSDA